jgi:hypothetical protein
MALTTIPLPYGLRQVQITPYTTDAATVLAASSVRFPHSRTFSFSETEEFTELRGDDKLVAVHGQGPVVEWELEGGGFSFEAVKTMLGGTLVETGITPNQVKEYHKLDSDTRPYFKAQGRSISDSGGDFHCVVYRAKITENVELELSDGEFALTSASGQGLSSLVADTTFGRCYSFIQNETPAVIA